VSCFASLSAPGIDTALPFSDDEGVHWSLTELNSLASSRSEVLLLRLPGTADLL